MTGLGGASGSGAMRGGETLVSLFAGAGGLDLGLERAGFTTVVANELEPHACATLRANQLLSHLDSHEFDAWFDAQLAQRCYRDVTDKAAFELKRRLSKGRTSRRALQEASIVEGDIRAVTSDALANAGKFRPGEVTLVAGGPPCQPFSRAGKRESVDTDNGRLFLEFVRVVRDLRPRWFLFENVKGLLLTKTVVVESTCPRCRRKTIPGFDDRNRFLLDESVPFECACGATSSTGEAVNRPGGSLEIILAQFEGIGYKCRWRVLNAADFGVPQVRERLFIVGSRDGEDFEWPVPTHASPTQSRLAQLSLFAQGAQSTPWATTLSTLWPDGHPKYGPLDPDRAKLWVKNVVRPHAEPVTWTLDRPSPTVGAHQAAKLALAPHGVPEEQLARQQWHVQGRRQGDLPPVPVEHEYLTDRELLVLQSFPESWYLFGTRMERAFQIGNAVPVTLAEVVGGALMAVCGNDTALAEVGA